MKWFVRTDEQRSLVANCPGCGRERWYGLGACGVCGADLLDEFMNEHGSCPVDYPHTHTAGVYEKAGDK